ncbi:phosphoribosylamine--glycine ligase [Candidatus Berkelbacteria bacterium]|nr:phosphoribosylamine--glycine ligase [Candidatus Berkelbacteria bacterium]
MKNVLVIGSGAREHALAWKLKQSKNIGEIFIAPGNAGTELLGKNVNINADDINGLINFAKNNNIDLTIVGPDNALALGIVDEFNKVELKIFGPTKQAAKIEWSKIFAKKLMQKYEIPTAKFETFTRYDDALTFLKKSAFPLVIKADGLALGKGVFICNNLKEATIALESVRTFGKKVIIEEFLTGQEFSAHALCDGKSFKLFPFAKDHKRIGEGDTGANTGGMGTICPIDGPTDQIHEIIEKTLWALKQERIEFSGCLFPGIILTSSGPKVLEFNARFGDPETQVFMRLLDNDLLEIFEAVFAKKLHEISLRWKKEFTTCVVLASRGYPNSYKTGYEITGLNDLDENIVVFHAGTKEQADKVVTNGGRVLSVTATGVTLKDSLTSAYNNINKIDFMGRYYRQDIGLTRVKA